MKRPQRLTSEGNFRGTGRPFDSAMNRSALRDCWTRGPLGVKLTGVQHSDFYSFAIRLVSPIIHPAALAELAEAVAFYEDRASGLGRDLLEEVERVLDIIMENPEVAPVFEAPYRR